MGLLLLSNMSSIGGVDYFDLRPYVGSSGEGGLRAGDDDRMRADRAHGDKDASVKVR